MDENEQEEDSFPIRLEDLGLAVPTYLEQEAIYMHEIFASLCMAGFTETQALRLTAMIATDGQPPSQPVDISQQAEFSFEFDEDGEEYDEDEDEDES